jgi:hypothetical protein
MRLGRITTKTESYTHGYLKKHEVQIEREGKKDESGNYQYSIIVQNDNGLWAYNGYWKGKSMKDAIIEAIKGSCLD